MGVRPDAPTIETIVPATFNEIIKGLEKIRFALLSISLFETFYALINIIVIEYSGTLFREKMTAFSILMRSR